MRGRASGTPTQRHIPQCTSGGASCTGKAASAVQVLGIPPCRLSVCAITTHPPQPHKHTQVPHNLTHPRAGHRRVPLLTAALHSPAACRAPLAGWSAPGGGCAALAHSQPRPPGISCRPAIGQGMAQSSKASQKGTRRQRRRKVAVAAAVPIDAGWATRLHSASTIGPRQRTWPGSPTCRRLASRSLVGSTAASSSLRRLNPP